MVKKFRQAIRKLVLGNDISTYYYAQAGEDAILKGLFNDKLRNKEKGYYVDIGAHHPSHHSNTLLFYKEGWRGINVDPRPEFLPIFQKARSRDVNLNIGISNEEGSMDFYYYGKNSTINTFVPSDDSNYEKIIKVDIRKLSNVLAENVPDGVKIDFLSIDVEGYEMQVLESNDWEKYKPAIIAMEQDSYLVEDAMDHPTTKFLLEKDYKLVAKSIVRPGISTLFFNLASELLNK